MSRATMLVVLIVACDASNNGPDDGNTGDGGGGDGNHTNTDAGLGAPGGGPLADLRFAIVGDTRPPADDDTAGYPTTIVNKIYADIAAESPQPSFVISTGDHMFSSPSHFPGTQMAQLSLYMQARAKFNGPFYATMGNHECTGATNSNCGTGNSDGVTANMTDFINVMLHPVGVTMPYYQVQYHATDNSWSANFVFIACNAWDAAQASWLQTALATQATYTFVMRHESNNAVAGTPTPPCGQSVQIIAQHPLTLLIVGHAHEYLHVQGDHEVVMGLGGAPLVSGTNYGYTIVARNSNGTLTATTYDYMTHATIDSFTIQPNGLVGSP
jgi:hypothetical protein